MTFGSQSRKINSISQYYPRKILEEFCIHTGLNIKNLRNSYHGNGFKGEPETNDLRGSVSIELYRSLSKIVAQVFILIGLLEKEFTDHQPKHYQRYNKNINDFDAIIIMIITKKMLTLKIFFQRLVTD